MGRRRYDLLLAVLAGATAVAVYLRTLYPGLNGIGDTPKFQFIGAVLGTPHPPGYPVYTLLLWVFAHLPFGNPAWRANLLSALVAAAATALLFLVARRLACGRASALAAALAFAFGRVMWSQATLAEVYALAAALLAAVLLLVVSWGASRAPRLLDAGVFLTALGMAHHTTVAMVAPALALYVIATDARVGLSPRFLGRAVVLVALGLSPYLLILVRNWQGAPYLGARATTLGELWDVMRGASFEGRLFAFSVHDVLTGRVALIGRILVSELTPPGALLALVGLWTVGRERWREAALFGFATLGLVLFALNYDVPDIDVFLVPAFVLLWPLVGCGLDRVLRPWVAGIPALSLVALALPAWLLASNYRGNDHHDRSFEMRYFAALFEALPARAAIAAESYTVDHMVRYELLGEQAARGRDIVTIPADPESVDAALAKGYVVFAFQRTEEELAALGYRFTPARLLDLPLPAYLRTLPRGRVVVRAGRDAAGRFAAIGTAGEPDLRVSRSAGDAHVDAPAGAPLGRSGAPTAVSLRAASGTDGASVSVAEAVVARSASGVAFAALAPGGRVLEAHDLDPASGLRVPFTSRAFPVYRMSGRPECVDVGRGAWIDATSAAATGRALLRVDNHEPYAARLVLWLTSNASLAPRLVEHLGVGAPELEVRDLAGASLRAALLADGLQQPWTRAVRLEIRVNDQGQFSASSVDLGGAPVNVFARADVDLKNPKRASVCRLDAPVAP